MRREHPQGSRRPGHGLGPVTAGLRTAGLGLVVVLLGLWFGAAPSAAYEIDYAQYDVVVTDTQGVVTEGTDFGFWTGPNVITTHRGDSIVEVPFRKIRRLEMGAYTAEKGVWSCTITAKTGAVITCQVERMEGSRILAGESAIGSFRLRLDQIRRLDLVRLSRTGDVD
jgi:hypothetical protein